MTNTPNPETTGDQDLDTMAQQLLGIDISSKDIDDDVLDLEDDELPPIAAAGEPESEDEPIADEIDASPAMVEQVTPADEFEDEFGGGLGLVDSGDEEEEEARVEVRPASTRPQRRQGESAARSTSPAAAERPDPDAGRPEPNARRPEPDAARPEPDDESTTESAAEREEQDDYWDALDGWDWGESDTGPGDETATAEPAPSAEERHEPERPLKATPVRDDESFEEFLEDDEFGAGLDEVEAAAAARTGSRRAPDRERGDEGRERRGRRGRRRPRKPERAPEEAAATEFDGSESGEEESGFGSGIEVDEESAEAGRRSGRGRRSRDRGRRRKDSRPRAREEDESSASSALAEEPGAEADDSERPARDKYRNVPTWQEAIDALVQVRKKSNGGRSAERSAKSERRSQGSGRPRRRGGRGRGRRRPSDQ